MDLNALIKQIQENREDIQNLPMEYDDLYSHKWDSELKEIFKGKWVINSTDFTYGKGFVYGIVLESNIPFVNNQLVDDLKRVFWSIEFRLSVVLPYYLVNIYKFITESNNIIDRILVENPKPEMRRYLTLARQFAEEQGYRPLPLEFLDVVVPDIELKLADPGKATVFNCLFADYSTDQPWW